MTTPLRDHAPVIQHWAATATSPEELSVECTCGAWAFDSQASISSGIEPWGDDYAQHVEEADQ